MTNAKTRKGIIMSNQRLELIVKSIIDSAVKVHKTLGCGFFEKVYENAMLIELENRGISVKRQESRKVLYEGILVGEFKLDLLVEDEIIVELKATKELTNNSYVQLLNYLKASDLKLGLVLNFGEYTLNIKRVVNNY